MNFKTYFDMNYDISSNIQKIQDGNYDLVVGIPRSGMIPAYMIALLLNTHCTDLPSLLRDAPLVHGKHRKIPSDRAKISLPSESQSILLVDDSICTGNSLREELETIPKSLRQRITTLAIYSSEVNRSDVDVFLEYLPLPRAFEWNLFHHGVMERSCVDIDGVLCRDPTNEENDDGDKYIEFILNVPPLILPTRKIHALVTSRLEKFREPTERWLSKHRVEYERLIMLDLPSKEERIRRNVHAMHKANYYDSTEARLFVESEKRQAKEISRITGKAVYCYENNSIYIGGETNDKIHHQNFLYDGRQLTAPELIMQRTIEKLTRLKKRLLG